MRIKKLDRAFYADNFHLEEALDNYGGLWEEGKARGYGVVIINLNNLTFAIPLRSNIQHKSAYLTVKKNNRNPSNKGLDFTKALLIKEERYITTDIFRIPLHEHKKLKNKTSFISETFEKYVGTYIKARNNKDMNILESSNYRYTTLINYHSELGL